MSGRHVGISLPKGNRSIRLRAVAVGRAEELRGNLHA
jgi:hypothetical protein